MSQHTADNIGLSAAATGGEASPGFDLRRWVLGGLLVLLALFAARGAWGDIIHIVRRDEEASHILLVPPVFGWLLWTCRQKLREATPAGSLWALAIILAGWGFWAYGNIRGITVFWHFGAIVMAVGAFTSVVGVRVLRDAWPAFLVLLFLMPVPGTVRQPVALAMQNASAQLTELAMMLLGQPIERSGNVLIINGQEIGIAEACNGMRMVTMLGLVCYTFVFVHPLRWWVRALLILIAAPLAVFGNLLRLVPTVYAYGYASHELADSLHTALGWVMVVVAYFMLMGVVALLRWLLLPVTTDEATDRVRPVFKRRPLPGKTHSAVRAAVSRLPWWLPGAAAAGVLVGVVAHGQSFPTGESAQPYHAAVRDAVMGLPMRIGPWVGSDVEVPEAATALLKPNAILSRRYRHEQTGKTFDLLLVQCADARDMEGHFPPNCYPAFGWTEGGASPVSIDTPNLAINAMTYRFTRAAPGGGSYGAWVTNIIILPQGRFATRMQELRRLAGTYTDRFFGAAQVQLVFSDRWEASERRAVAEQVATEIEPLIELVLRGGDDPPGPGTQTDTTQE